MNICKKLALIVVAIVLLSTLNTSSAESISEDGANEKKKSEVDDTDYFYDSSLSKSEIKQLQEEKMAREKEREREEAAKRTTETPPEWFAPSNDTEDPMAKYMETAIKEYMKKMQKEYMEKMKSKKKSEIDHPFWSVVTLSVFFGTGILIGISVVVIRGSKFNKGSRLSSSGANGGKKSKNGARESIKKTDYVSVPQNEQITI